MKRYLTLIKRDRVLRWWLWEIWVKRYLEIACMLLRSTIPSFREHPLLEIFLENIHFCDPFYYSYSCSSNLILLFRVITVFFISVVSNLGKCHKVNWIYFQNSRPWGIFFPPEEEGNCYHLIPGAMPKSVGFQNRESLVLWLTLKYKKKEIDPFL